MSLYNMLFGKNPLSQIVLQALNISEAEVPRFRDAYYDAEEGCLVIHTRTGGGNREDYEDENDSLRSVPGFIRDCDDDFDCTYANWFYNAPESFRPIFDELKAIGAGQDAKPAERWQAVLDGLRTGATTPETERALKVGEAIFGQINAAVTKSEGGAP